MNKYTGVPIYKVIRENVLEVHHTLRSSCVPEPLTCIWSLACSVDVFFSASCQNKCEELENQVQDLLYEQRVLRKDKADVTRYLKRSLDAKDKKVEMLMEQVESQQEAAERQKESMEQLEATVAQLEAHIEELNGEISTQGQNAVRPSHHQPRDRRPNRRVLSK